MLLLTPFSQGTHLLSVGRLIVVGDQAYHRCVISKFDDDTSSTRTISTGAPQGCVLSPLFFSLYMNDYTSKDSSVKLLKFADNTTPIGLIQDGNESAYRQEVKELALWYSLNNLELNTLKTVEMIMDFRRNLPATIMNSTVTAVEAFRFLGTTISQDQKWNNHIRPVWTELSGSAQLPNLTSEDNVV